MPRHAVFLSYASEDRAIVDRIKEQLDEAGIDAWFDRAELQPGGSWAQVIRANIDSSAAFVPIISASAQRPGAREFRVEWELALEVRKRRPREPDGTPARFIVPVVIDGTGMQEDGVRPYFGDIHGVNLPGGQLSDEFCAKLRELVRHAQLASEIPR